MILIRRDFLPNTVFGVIPRQIPRTRGLVTRTLGAHFRQSIMSTRGGNSKSGASSSGKSKASSSSHTPTMAVMVGLPGRYVLFSSRTPTTMPHSGPQRFATDPNLCSSLLQPSAESQRSPRPLKHTVRRRIPQLIARRIGSSENLQNPVSPCLSHLLTPSICSSFLNTNPIVGWVHINQDALGTAAECKKALEKAIKHGKNVVLGTETPPKHYPQASLDQ